MDNNSFDLNPDSEDDVGQPTGNGVGHANEVNEGRSGEMSGFVATEDELCQLVKCWWKECLDIDFIFVVYGTASGSWNRLYSYALERIGRIARVLGDDVVREAVKEAEKEFGNKVDPLLWKAFLENDTATIDAWRRADGERQGPPEPD